MAGSPVAHTFVSFGFDNAPPVSISIETRPEIGEGFDPLPSLFKQFELIYVVGDERDLVRVRTDYRNEDVFLYRLRTSPEVARRLFLVYLDRINELADRPEFYHLFSNSCTINIVRYANLAGRVGRLDIRHILNGWSDRYLYDAGAWIRACHLQNCAGVLASMRPRRLPGTRRISPSSFANPCRHHPADISFRGVPTGTASDLKVIV